MTRLSINLTDDLTAKVAVRAAESGHNSIEQYVEALLRSDAEATGNDLDGPEHLRVDSENELESVLLARIGKGQPVEATPAFWQSLRDRVSKRGAGKP